MRAFRLAIPTKGKMGLNDHVSDVFGRAEFFTIIDIKDGSVNNVKIVENPASTYKHGAGPIVVKTLSDMNVDVVAAGEFGPGVSTLLDYNGIKKVLVEPDMLVERVIELVLAKFRG